MITKDKIIEAAIEYEKQNPMNTLAASFKDGVDWYKEELWHYSPEEPEEDGKVLCVDIDNEFILIEADADWKQKVGIYYIRKWCYLNDLV